MGGYTRFEDINLTELPDSFAIKATHGCKMNYLVPDKSKFDSEKCKKEIQRWMDTTYGTYSMEPHYIEIPHRFYIEKYLEKADQLVDYKFHCLNGEPQFVLTCSDRKSNGDKAMQVTLDLFDMDWKPIPEIVSSGLERPGDGKLPRPENLDEMIRIAKILSEDFKFVRVDLYELEGKVYFGELTFSPAHCVFPYLSDKFDLESSTSRYSSYISLFCFALNRLFSALTLVFDILTYFVLYVACGCLGNIWATIVFRATLFGTTQGKLKICTEFEDLAIFQSKSFFFVWRFYREKHKFCC